MQTVKISNSSSNFGRYVNYMILFQESALKTIPLTLKYIHFSVNFSQVLGTLLHCQRALLGTSLPSAFLEMCSNRYLELSKSKFHS